ncbi:unnamed protein product [Cuscuta campestris]|uniref:Uncharacterized protein n=1 Tax=Cuscuta campestris TaxID=132261 RepID=A0A484LII2_9ASTE|nr:unnamed protein product [Cuscuta campestris]
MRIYIRSINFQLWLIIKNGETMPMKKVGETTIPKKEEEYDAEDIKKVEAFEKAKHMIFCAINPDDYRKISSCSIAKEMWDKLEVTYEDNARLARKAIYDDLADSLERVHLEDDEEDTPLYTNPQPQPEETPQVMVESEDQADEEEQEEAREQEETELPIAWKTHRNHPLDQVIGSINRGDKSRAATSGKSKSKSRAPTSSSEERLYYGDGSYLWFDSEEERTRFLTFFSKRVVAPPRIIPERYPELQGYDELDAQLHQAGLWPFVSRAHKEINPALIRAFYSNLRREDDVLYSLVKSTSIELTVEQLGRIAGLPFQGDDVSHYGGEDWVLNNEGLILNELCNAPKSGPKELIKFRGRRLHFQRRSPIAAAASFARGPPLASAPPTTVHLVVLPIFASTASVGRPRHRAAAPLFLLRRKSTIIAVKCSAAVSPSPEVRHHRRGVQRRHAERWTSPPLPASFLAVELQRRQSLLIVVELPLRHCRRRLSPSPHPAAAPN